jgi:hypothetical protein
LQDHDKPILLGYLYLQALHYPLARLVREGGPLAPLSYHNASILPAVSRQPDFSGVRIKVEQAKHHFGDLQARYDRFQENHPYRLVRDDEPQTGDLVYRVELSDQPWFWWSAIAGDCVHNLRSSLDLLVCEMVRAEGYPVQEHTRFPVFNSADAFANVLKSDDIGKVKGAPKAAVDIIMKAEPYTGANNLFGALHQLDIEDKHKLLVPVGLAHKGTIDSFTMADVLDAYPGATTIKLFEIPTARGIGIVAPRVAFPLEDGAEIYRVPARLRDDPVAQMHMNSEFRIEVAFGEVEVVKGKSLIETLGQLIKFVEGFVNLFLPLFS